MFKSILKWSAIIGIGVLIIFQLMTVITTPLPSENTPAIPAGDQCVAMNYHRVTPKSLTKSLLTIFTQSKEITTYDVDSDVFVQQLDELIAANVYFATPDDLLSFQESGEYPDKCVWISFDDVDESVYEHAFPLLQERQIPFTLFIISGQVGANDFKNLQLADWDQLRAMRDSGLANFGSHTHDFHYLLENGASFLQNQNFEDFKTDIITSKERLEFELNMPISAIAYPFGNTSKEIMQIISDVGFNQGFILAPYPITAEANNLYLPRYLVSETLFNESIRPWLLINE